MASMLCSGKTAKGNFCRYKAVIGGTCRIHARFADPCPICFEPGKLVAGGVCGHKFCRDCIRKIVKCALCRAVFVGRVKRIAHPPPTIHHPPTQTWTTRLKPWLITLVFSLTTLFCVVGEA